MLETSRHFKRATPICLNHRHSITKSIIIHPFTKREDKHLRHFNLYVPPTPVMGDVCQGSWQVYGAVFGYNIALKQSDVHEKNWSRTKDEECCGYILVISVIHFNESYSWWTVRLNKALLGQATNDALRTKNIHHILLFEAFTLLKRGIYSLISDFGLSRFTGLRRVYIIFSAIGPSRFKNEDYLKSYFALWGTYVFRTKNIHCPKHVCLTYH